MSRLIVASMSRSAGKTSLVVGLGQTLKKKVGYIKPFGDRLLYRKKRLWDYDAALITSVFGLDDNPENLSIGFDHSKLRFMYDEAGIAAKLAEMLAHVESGKEVICIEGGADIRQGISVHLDAVSLARFTQGTLVIVTSGDEGGVLDDAAFIKRHLDLDGVNFAGLIINKVHDPEDFKNAYLGDIRALGLPVLGVVPHHKELTSVSVGFLAEALFAKVLSGQAGLGQVVRNIFVGAMSSEAALRNPFFGKEEKLVITPGDRSDMILAALEAGARGILLTNNITPPANIISAAGEKGVPLMLVTLDTFQAAKQVDDLEALLTQADERKVALLGELVAGHLDIAALGL